MFPDAAFADLFDEKKGRRSVPPSVVATVMVLQRLEGLSDREAVERYCFDNRWRYAAGVGGYDGSDWSTFAHTVLVDMRERLRNSADPDRILAAALDAAKDAGLVGRKRARDSTPLCDTVATMETITLIRSAIRGLVKVADADLEDELRHAMTSGDDYASAAKPQIDWDDKDAQAGLVDPRAKDAYDCLAVLDGRDLAEKVEEAARLLATMVGQDLEVDGDGTFRIARKVATDPETRHGHKTQAKGFDGYKGHVGIDPGSEIITATAVTPGNAGDAGVAEDLISDVLGDGPETAVDDAGNDNEAEPTEEQAASREGADEGGDEAPTVYGDNAYGTGGFQSRLEDEGIDSKCKTQKPNATDGLFSKDRFTVDLDDDTVTCPASVSVSIRRHSDGDGIAMFAGACVSCALEAQCTKAKEGRNIVVGPNEAAFARASARQRHPDWIADFKLLAAAVNLARLGMLGARSTHTGWSVAGA